MLVFRSYHIKLLGCLALLMMARCIADAKPWRGIVPLHTTRVAVEQKLGPPSMDRGDTVVYDYQNERASIEYSKGPCSVEFSQWNVPRETVISIWITPKTDINAADLGLGKNYKRVRDEHRPQLVHYIDEEVGIEYNVDEASGFVGLVKYLPSAADKNLRCPERANGVPTFAYPFAKASFDPFDSYGAISWEDEKAHLDNFAIALQHGPDSIGYIIVYAGRRACVGEANERALRAKKYVVETRGIQASRIKWIDGGYREGRSVILQLAPRGAPGTTASPALKPSEVQIIKNCKPKTPKSRQRGS